MEILVMMLQPTCCVTLDKSLLFVETQFLTYKIKGSGTGQELKLFSTLASLPTLTPVTDIANKGRHFSCRFYTKPHVFFSTQCTYEAHLHTFSYLKFPAALQGR